MEELKKTMEKVLSINKKITALQAERDAITNKTMQSLDIDYPKFNQLYYKLTQG